MTKFTKYLLGEYTNKKEDGKLSLEMTSSLFEQWNISGDKGSYRTNDIEEMQGHFDMFCNMLETYAEPLSESLIKCYHYCQLLSRG